jgi:putative ATP-dependent endonuclease of OLD family
MNKTIQSVFELEHAQGKIRLVACKTCFETALFGTEEKDEKPYRAFLKIQNDANAAAKVKELLDFLLDSSKPKPENCIEWEKVEDLSA